MDRTAADWPEPAVAPVATRQELLQAALRRSAERGRRVGRRRLAWRWTLYLLGWLLRVVVVPAVLMVAALQAWAPEQLPGWLNAALPLGERAATVPAAPATRAPVVAASVALPAASSPEAIASTPVPSEPAESASAAEHTLRLRLDPQERAPRAPARPATPARSTASAPSGAALSQETP